MEPFDADQVIHNNLIEYVTNYGIPELYDIWKTKMKITPFLLSWPSETVVGRDNEPIQDVCSLDLPEDRSEWPSLFHQAMELTKSCALLLVEERNGTIKAILETPKGTMAWTIPIERRGDVRILKKASTTTDQENIGLLWRPNQGRG